MEKEAARGILYEYDKKRSERVPLILQKSNYNQQPLLYVTVLFYIYPVKP